MWHESAADHMKGATMRAGPTKYCKRESILTFGSYGNDGIALLAHDPESGEQNFTATVNIEPYGARKIDPLEVWIKDWSENEGVADAMVKAGLIELTGETHQTGYVHAKLARLIGNARTGAQQYLMAG